MKKSTFTGIAFLLSTLLSVNVLAQPGVKNKSSLGFSRMHLPKDADMNELVKQKNKNIKKLGDVLKGGIWDEIIPNLLYVPPAKYYVVYEGTDSLNPIENKYYSIHVSGNYLLATEITNKIYSFFLLDSTDEKYKPHYGEDTSMAVSALFKEFSEQRKGINYTINNYDQLDDFPVVGISIDAAKAFCNWLNQKIKTVFDSMPEHPRYFGFRLPTETEFEKAIVMNGMPERFDTTLYKETFSIKRILEKKKKFTNDGYLFTNPVRLFPAGKLGFYGLSGNVSEWTFDIYAPTRSTGKKNAGSVFNSPVDRRYHVVKGGSWADNAFYLQPCTRQKYNGESGSEKIGFRIAMTDPGLLQ